MKLPELPVKPELTPAVVIGLIILLTILAVGGIFYFAGFFTTSSTSQPTANLAILNQSSGSSYKYTATVSNLSLSSVNLSDVEIVLNVSTSTGFQPVILQFNNNSTFGSSTGVNAYWYATVNTGALSDGTSIQISYIPSPGYSGNISSTPLFGPLSEIQVYALGVNGGELAAQSI